MWCRAAHRDGKVRPGSGGYHDEIIIRPRRALSCRYPVNRLAEQPERYGDVTNRNGLRHPASQHHGRRAEASERARPQRPGVTPQGSGRVAHRAGRASRAAQTVTGTPSVARGPVMAKLARLEREASSCNDGCESSFRRGKDPLGWMQRIDGVLLGFLSNLQRHTHPQGLRAMRGNQNVPGMGPTTILVVLHRHAGWREISGHRTRIETGSARVSRRDSGPSAHR